MTSDVAGNAELTMTKQTYSKDPLSDRETGHYRKEYVTSFVDKWDDTMRWIQFHQVDMFFSVIPSTPIQSRKRTNQKAAFRIR